MARPRRTLILAATLLAALHLPSIVNGAIPVTVAFTHQSGRVNIFVRDALFATYVYEDGAITRPYFCNVHAPCAVKVTRPHPVTAGELDDHPTMHPGIWLAFGDLNGHDYWRNKARVVHAGFHTSPTSKNGRGEFAVTNHYLATDSDDVVAKETCHLTILSRPTMTVISWDSTFTPAGNEPLVFGDQEEMGLGVRLATSVAEKSEQGGLLTNSKGQTSAKNVWGRLAAWCDYSGVVEEQPVGITIAAHPDNFRKPWWHARNYGFMAANPFGRAAMKQGEPSQVVVKPGEEFRLRFAVIVHNDRPGDGFSVEETLSFVWQHQGN